MHATSLGTPSARGPISLVAVLVLFVLLVQVRLWMPYWETHNVQAILTWDVMGYYLYLPAKFIYHDLGRLKFADDIMREYSPTGSFYQAFQVPGAPAGQLVMKYPIGLALLWTPFFWLGHWAAGWWSYPQDGFSAPYQIAIAFGGLLYALLGLGLLRRLLLHYFTDTVATLVLVTLVLGTNYFQYAVFDTAMPHNYLFTGYAGLLLLTRRWHLRPTRGVAFAIGLVLGLLVLIRPSEAVAAVLPVLWGVGSWPAARARLALLRTRWPDVALLVLGGLLGVLPQGIYWHWATGHWLFYSYGDQHFSFLRPHLWEVLFSFRKGWLIYSPLLALVLLGFGPLWRRHRGLAVPVLVYFVLNLWVVSAWDIWWYGGSLGCRALVPSYAVLALPWGAGVVWLLTPGRQRRWPIAAAAAAVLFVDLNLFQNWQYARSIIHPGDMNRAYYFAVFNKTMPTEADYAKLDEAHSGLPRAERYYHARSLGKLDFEQTPAGTDNISAERAYSGRQSYFSKSDVPYSPTLTLPLGPAGLWPDDYIRASCQVFSDYGAWGSKLVLSLERDGKALTWYGVRLQNPGSVPRSWNHAYFDMHLPADTRPTDVLKVYVTNEGGAACFIDDMEAAVMEPVKK